MAMDQVTRRRFLQGVGATGIASALPARAAANAPAAARGSGRRAKNVLFLVSDGMGVGTLALTEKWRRQTAGQGLEWMRLYGLDGARSGLQDTASASSAVTDSAAAGSAWGSGERVPNGKINTTADGRELTPIFERARERGMATGLASTCRITHATPAAFAANVPDRDMEDAIARQYLEREVDVVLGGGRPHFPEELRDAYAKSGHERAETAGELERAAQAAKTKRLLGLFADSHMPYAIDRARDRALAQTPGLVAMFESALAVLERAENGFFLQVEGGRVDHAGHANDPGAIVRDQLEFDAAVGVALDYVERSPDTLLIVTTDHGTGGCQLNGVGPAYNDTDEAIRRLGRIEASIEAYREKVDAPSRIRPLMRDFFGVEPAAETEERLREAMGDDDAARYAFGDAVARELEKHTGVGWTSSNHTGEFVEFLALGPGAEATAPCFENARVFDWMAEAIGARV